MGVGPGRGSLETAESANRHGNTSIVHQRNQAKYMAVTSPNGSTSNLVHESLSAIQIT